MQKACCETCIDLNEVVERLRRRAELQGPLRTVVCHSASTSQKSFLVELSFSYAEVIVRPFQNVTALRVVIYILNVLTSDL